MKSIKTIEDACNYLDLDYKTVIPNFSFFPKKDREALLNYAELMIITDALNRTENNTKEWFPDWNNSSEYKYHPWFKMGSSGFRYNDYANWNSYSTVGSRLCFKTSELAKYAGEQFQEKYEKCFIKKPIDNLELSGKKVSIEIEGKTFSATID